MEEVELQSLMSKTAYNLIFLSLRNIGIQLISTAGFFILTLLLGTGEVGLFAVVSEAISILGYFSDIGLASALIQQKEEITKDQLQTTFFIQQTLVIIALFIVFLIYPSISHSKSYGSKELWIVLSLCFSFVAASLKTIPSVLLERKLNFKLISSIDVLENISFYLVAVIFAFFHFGAYSYAIATFFRSILGLVLIYIFSSWPIGISFSYKVAKKLFRFGIPFQLNSFIAVAKDRLSNLLVAGILGRESFGILSWAQKAPRIPLSQMDAIMRVTFPTFSRLQDHPEVLAKSIKRSIYYISFFVFPALAGISLVAANVVNVIPHYNKWLPAIIPLYFFCINAAIASVTTPLTNAFNAIGKITITTKLMIMWTVLTWLTYPILSIKFGFVGTSIAALIVGLSSFVVWYIAWRLFQISILKTIFHPLVASLLMIIIIFPIQLFIPDLLTRIISEIVLGVSIYAIYSYFFSRLEIKWFVNQIKIMKNANHKAF
ncbi:MAG: oligosaccharide flippase family protein [Patescibacteria group bacterium]